MSIQGLYEGSAESLWSISKIQTEFLLCLLPWGARLPRVALPGTGQLHTTLQILERFPELAEHGLASGDLFLKPRGF